MLPHVRIDLHTHTRASDGTHSPSELVALAAAQGLDVVGLTDHDSAAGWDEAARAAAEVDVTIVLGLEISTKYSGAGVHLLAYLPDPAYPPLVDELDRILEGRTGRLAAMLARLRAAGLEIEEQEVMRRAGTAAAIGRPHVADVLVAKGYVADRTEAFATWLDYGRAGYVNRYATSTTDMVRIVSEAGGAAVIAHPWGRGSRQVLDRAVLAELRGAGLVGIEVDHQDHDAGARVALRELAADLGLVVTGSSDFHGTGKVDHELGCNLTAPDQYERLLDAAARNASATGSDVPVALRP